MDDLDLAAALALDALEGDERTQAEALVAERPELAAHLERFRSAAALVGGASIAAAPPSLRAGVVARAREVREPGVPTGPWAAPEIEVSEGFARVIGRFDALLSELSHDEWTVPVAEYPGWTVRDVVAHLVGVDRIMLTELGDDDVVLEPGTEEDHLASTEALAAPLAVLPVPDLHTHWRETSGHLVALAAAGGAEGMARSVKVPTLIALPLRTVLVARIFEVWTQAEDICRATGRPLPGVDPSMLRLMCPVALDAVPYGLALAGAQRRGDAVRVVLTGPGGGTWTVALALGERHDESGALLVADAMSFCRLAAKRMAPDELGGQVTGDRALVDALLAGVAMFAA